MALRRITDSSAALASLERAIRHGWRRYRQYLLEAAVEADPRERSRAILCANVERLLLRDLLAIRREARHVTRLDLIGV